MTCHTGVNVSNRRKVPKMNNNKYQFMSCGASAVIVDENGQMTTSVDTLVNGVKRLFGKRSRRSMADVTTVHVRA